VSTVCARYYLEAVTPDDLERMMSEVDRAVREVASARVDVVVQSGTPGTFTKGYGHDAEVIKRIEQIAGVPATTSMTASLEALRLFGASRLAVATAYNDDMNQRLEAYLVAAGFNVAGIRGLGFVKNVNVGDEGPETAYRFGRQVVRDVGPTDALLISCGNLRTFEVIEALEEDLGIPVTSSSQAGLWHALHLAGVHTRIWGYGSLLRMRPVGTREPVGPGVGRGAG
jgi:maleate isomerase